MDNAYNRQDTQKTKTSRPYVKKFFPGPGPRRVILGYITLDLNTISILYATMFFLSTSSPPPFSGGFLTLYSPFWLILALHLLIMQVITRVLVPLNNFLNLLWVAVTKKTLFRGLFHINAARIFGGVHKMWWLLPSL